MKIYTRRGDGGETDLFGGGRVGKDHLRVRAYGDVDELNACIGVAAAASNEEDLRADLERIQGSLFDLGSQLATPDPDSQARRKVPALTPGDIEALEARIDALESDLGALQTFILPGGTPPAAALHHARGVCRRAERNAVALAREEEVDAVALRYLNRLSDLLFVMARAENHRAGVADVAWVGRERV